LVFVFTKAFTLSGVCSSAVLYTLYLVEIFYFRVVQ
jgi:hypothetical protein